MVSNRAGSLPAVRALAVLSSITNPGFDEGLAALVRDPSVGIDARLELVKYLASCGEPAAQEAIYGVLTGNDGALRAGSLEYVERNGMSSSSALTGRLAAVLTNRTSTQEEKRTAVVLLGYSGTQAAIDALNAAVKLNDSPAVARAAFYALVNANGNIPREIAMRFAQDNLTASVALKYMAQNDMTDALKNLYSNAYNNTTLRDRIALALSVYVPGTRALRLGV